MRVTAFRTALIAVSIAPVALLSQDQTVRIRAAKALDGTDKALSNVTITIQGSKITSIGPDSSGAATYNLSGLTVMPGMIDVHAHVGWHFDKDGRYASRPGTPAQEILYSAENAYVTLMAGFTTIQSPGQANDVELRDAIARGDETIPAVLGRAKTDAVVGKTKVADLLKSLPGYGPAKVSALLEQTGIDASRRAAGLGDRQKQALLDALG